MKKYSVRKLGCTSWTDTNNIKTAKKERIYANKNIQDGHVIINNRTNTIITEGVVR